MDQESKDTESLQTRGRRRGSCLDAFLVASIVFLFVAVTAMGVVVATVVMKTPSQMPSSRGNTSYAAYKMENFVYLEAAQSELENYTMSLRSVYFGEGTSVGSNFVFDEEQRSLTPNTAGMYFIYIDLNFTCTYSCTSGLLSVKLDDKLTCEVNLPSVADSTPVTKKCWAVRRLERQRLFTQMTVPKGGLDNWKLTLKGSGLGMMLMV